jgi:hypothetical protein
VITGLREVQQKKAYTSDPLFWVPGEKQPRPITKEDGPLLTAGLIKPAMQLVVELNSEQVVFANGFMLNAIRDAVREAGATAPEIGGKLGLQVTELVPTAFKPRKKFAAKYAKPE